MPTLLSNREALLQPFEESIFTNLDVEIRFIIGGVLIMLDKEFSSKHATLASLRRVLSQRSIHMPLTSRMSANSEQHLQKNLQKNTLLQRTIVVYYQDNRDSCRTLSLHIYL